MPLIVALAAAPAACSNEPTAVGHADSSVSKAAPSRTCVPRVDSVRRVYPWNFGRQAVANVPVAFGDTVDTGVPVPFSYNHDTFEGVLQPYLGSASVIDANVLRYVAPSGCTGADEVWALVRKPDGGHDTVIMVFSVVHPTVTVRDSVAAAAGETRVVRTLLSASAAAPRRWASARIVGYVGASRGTTTAASDTLVRYVAPSSFVGIDTVRPVVEATYKGTLFRDTTRILFNVFARTPAPSYSVVAISPANAAGASLSPAGVSSDGRVAGTMTFSNGETHAFAWSAGTFKDLGTYGGASTVGIGINNSGDVAGYAKASGSPSADQGLVWYAGGPIAEVPGGHPIPVGISNDGTVVTDTSSNLLGTIVFWRAAKVIKTQTAEAFRLSYQGLATDCHYASFAHTNCGVTYPDGQYSTAAGSAVISLNDAGDLWIADWDFGRPFSTHIVTQFETRETCCTVTQANAVWPEMVPADYVVPPYADTAGTSLLPLAGPQVTTSTLSLTASRSYLTPTTVVTTSGAYSIDLQISDKSWHLVRAVAMNDAGQIVALGYNSVTGVRAPIVLTPLR
ncbi:MAG: hypothetical protein JWM41_901 [Gemmatimonadetes bacterium]|nr:hypothetical protein [Gemmatimonadota bacterium]